MRCKKVSYSCYAHVEHLNTSAATYLSESGSGQAFSRHAIARRSCSNVHYALRKSLRELKLETFSTSTAKMDSGTLRCREKSVLWYHTPALVIWLT